VALPYALSPSRLPSPVRPSLRQVRELATLILSLLATPTWAVSAAAPNPAHAASAATARTIYGPLDAAQLGQIRAVSRAVLSAKAGERSTIEENELLGELHGLAASLDQALVLNAASAQLKVVPASSSSAAAPTIETSSRKTTVNTLLTPHLARLHERRAALIALSASGTEAQQQSVLHVQGLSQRMGGVEEALQKALAVSDDVQRGARLGELRKQLEPRTLAQWWEDRHVEAANAKGTAVLSESTPTITTLIRHRPGLGSARSTQP
jgi:hypothetical protein